MSKESYRLVVRDDPKSPVAEAIRTLRTNLQYVSLDKRLKTLMVTSAGPSEGKTMIASNLACSLAEAGVETTLVGVDLRKPSLHRVFPEVANRAGLTNVLLGELSLDEAIVPTAVRGLRALPSGPIPPNPAELLGSKAMQSVIEALRDSAEMVVFDSPPVVPVTDAALMAPAMDGTLLVVSLNQAPRETVKQAVNQLQTVRANIVGAVANRVETRSAGEYYYYYYAESEAEVAASSNGRPKSPSFFGRFFGRK